jgi:plastocyanin domain-containing protein
VNVAGVIVIIGAVAGIATLGWFFFAPRRARQARLEGGVQRIEVTVRGGYSPDVIAVRAGVPVELVFDRQESGDCTSKVVFPDLQVSAALPAFQSTTVRLGPQPPGQLDFACGMNMSSRDHHTSTAPTFTDPVCGMQISPQAASASRRKGQQTFYFCSPGCAEAFDAAEQTTQPTHRGKVSR